MKMLIMIVTTLGLSLLANVATADSKNSWATSQARLADKQQLRDSYLRRRYQTANVYDETDPMNAANKRHGAAWLIRSKNGVSGRIMTNVPTAGDPYTLWILVFNNPDKCGGVCGPANIGQDGVSFSIFNGTGAISSSNGDGMGGGVVNMDFDIVAGNLATNQFILLGDGNGLRRNRGFTAQVVLIVDMHPTITPGTPESWIKDLTETILPGTGPVVSQRTAVFAPCPSHSCPASIL